MNIILKQPEIVAAIRMYAQSQGISLHNKSLTVAFTSGRGNNGLSAELTIEDISIPGFDAPEATSGPSAEVLAMAAAVAPKSEQVILPGGGLVGQVQAPVVVDEPEVEVAVTAPATTAEVIEAGVIATPAVATPETEAAAAEPIAEALAAEVALDPAAAPRATTSLFAS